MKAIAIFDSGDDSIDDYTHYAGYVKYERFAGFGLIAARPVAVLLIVTALAVFVLLRALLRARVD